MTFVRTLMSLGAAAMLSAPAVAQYTRKSNGEIQFQNYPLEALKRGEEGTVGIKVRLDKRGRLLSCAVAKSSGFAALDAASCDLLIVNARMQPFLSADGKRIEKESTGEVVWKLPEDRKARIEQASLPVGPASADAKARLRRSGERVICRRQATIGSLVASTKTCLTAGEWQRQYNYAQEQTQDMRPKFLPGG